MSEKIRFRGLTSGEVIINKPAADDGDSEMVHANNIPDIRNLNKYFSGGLSTNNETSNTSGTRRIIAASGKLMSTNAQFIQTGDPFADGAATVGGLDKIKLLYVKNTGLDTLNEPSSALLQIFTSQSGGG